MRLPWRKKEPEVDYWGLAMALIPVINNMFPKPDHSYDKRIAKSLEDIARNANLQFASATDHVEMKDLEVQEADFQQPIGIQAGMPCYLKIQTRSERISLQLEYGPYVLWRKDLVLV